MFKKYFNLLLEAKNLEEQLFKDLCDYVFDLKKIKLKKYNALLAPYIKKYPKLYRVWRRYDENKEYITKDIFKEKVSEDPNFELTIDSDFTSTTDNLKSLARTTEEYGDEDEFPVSIYYNLEGFEPRKVILDLAKKYGSEKFNKRYENWNYVYHFEKETIVLESLSLNEENYFGFFNYEEGEIERDSFY